MELQNPLVMGRHNETDLTPNFIEGNANAITLDDLRNRCIVPAWANAELTIPHTSFIKTVYAAAKTVFPDHNIGTPEIRVSHGVHGRIPEALNKPTSQLLESDKTLYYQRMCFCIAVSIIDTINGNETSVIVGGVRALNNENLNSRPHAQLVKAFIGRKVKICSNLCIFGTSFVDKMEVMNEGDIYDGACELFRSFDPDADKRKLEMLGGTTMTTEDFTHVIGRMRLYEALSTAQRNDLGLPAISLGDQVLNSATRNFVSNPDFGVRNDGTISMWMFLNLLTEASKNSYIDRFIAREVNAMDTTFGICSALNGEDTPYKWFIQ